MRAELPHTVRNNGAAPIRVHLEPWGEVFVVHPGAELVFGDPKARNESVVLEERGEEIVLTADAECVVHVFHHGREVAYGYEAR